MVKKTPNLDDPTCKFYHVFKEEIMTTLQKLYKEMKLKEHSYLVLWGRYYPGIKTR